MADQEDRSFQPNTVSSNRGQMQGLGAGREEMDKQQAPDRGTHATSPQRTEPFDQSLDPTTNADRPSQADFSGQEPGEADGADRAPSASARPSSGALDRNMSGHETVGDLGVGTPANVDIHKLGQSDNPQQEWGEPAGREAVFSSDSTRKGLRTEAERGQGLKTRQHNKDAVSRRI